VKDTDVTVTAFMPSPTDTDFFRRADMGDTKIGTTDKDYPADVARQAFDAITQGQGKKVTGSLKTKAQGLANKVLPDGTKADAHRSMAEPGTAGDGGGRA
jgi:short-subunit dehydrogenase